MNIQRDMDGQGVEYSLDVLKKNADKVFDIFNRDKKCFIKII